jgi:hypothetical protein
VQVDVPGSIVKRALRLPKSAHLFWLEPLVRCSSAMAALMLPDPFSDPSHSSHSWSEIMKVVSGFAAAVIALA